MACVSVAQLMLAEPVVVVDAGRFAPGGLVFEFMFDEVAEEADLSENLILSNDTATTPAFCSGLLCFAVVARQIPKS